MKDKLPLSLPPEEALKIGTDAYIYGYPLVLMDVTREVMTAVPKPGARKAPVNQFVHLREFPDHTFTDVVSPNVDTLYSVAWLDLSKGPIVLSLPDAGDRYYLMPMLDAWTNVFAAPGKRTTGPKKGDFAIIGPQWLGRPPEEMQVIYCPTNMAWLIGRTQTNGKNDYAAVHAIQDQYRLTPLSAWGKAYTPPANLPVKDGIDARMPPVEQIAKMSASAFFTRLNTLMKSNAPAYADTPAIQRFAAVGIAPGRRFDLKSFEGGVAERLEASVREAQARIAAEAQKSHGTTVNGWSILPDNTANFGTDYPWRAVVAMVGLGANLPEDAVYPHATADSEGQPFVGTNKYVIRFEKGQLPPARAFWSITMYNAQQFLVQNPIHRYAIGDRDKLKFDADGSLPIYVQSVSPGQDKESNWLPTPHDSFNLFMRLYWPTDEVLNGRWTIPAVERVHD